MTADECQIGRESSVEDSSCSGVQACSEEVENVRLYGRLRVEGSRAG